MKAISIQEFGDPDGMVLVDLPEPKPSDGERCPGGSCSRT
jgi:NADPH:quinone reductase-like Zn-dependent oxidoreductase